MKKSGIRFIIFILIISLSIPAVYASAEGEAVALSLSCADNANYGGEIKVRITVAKPTVSLAGLEFTLKYDSEFVSPVVTENSEENSQMDSFATKIPKGWEQMHHHDDEEKEYHFRFVAADGGSALKTASAIVLEVPFTVNNPGSFTFEIPDSDIIAVASDSRYTLHGGSGGKLSMMASGEAEKLAVELSDNNTAYENGIYYLDIEATNLGDSAGIAAFEFELQYDSAVFEPFVADNDKNQMDSFMVSMPENAWEQMCTHYDGESRYVLRFAANHAESPDKTEILKSGSSVKLSVPFKVIGSEGDVASFTVASSSVKGVNNSTEIIIGRGSTSTVSVEKGSEIKLPVTLGYRIEDGCLVFVPEQTDVSAFLKPLSGFYLLSGADKVKSGYVCTNYQLTDGKSAFLDVVVRGDIDGNGIVDAFDYLLVKRTFFETYSPSKAEFLAMTFSEKGKVTAYDYIYIKRHVFDTLNINELVVK